MDKLKGWAPLIAGVVVALAAITVGGVLVHMNGHQDGDATGALWFVALLVVIIMALTMTAAVFAFLKLSDPKEAFALPGGSIRALLAIGIMTLLVVFGLRTLAIGQEGELSIADKPFATISVPIGKDLNEEAKLYRTEEVFVLIEPTITSLTTGSGSAPGGAPAPKSDAPAPKTDAPAPKADVPAPKADAAAGQTPASGSAQPALAGHLKLYAVTRADTDIAKQLVTAIITLLTTVIGFYFGSRSTTDGMSAAAATPPPTSPAPPEDMTKDRKAIDERVAPFAVNVRKASEALLQNRDRQLLGDRELERVRLLGVADLALTAVTAARQALDKTLGEANTALAALTTEQTESARQAHVETGRKALAQAKLDLEAYIKTVEPFTTAVQQLVTHIGG